jgi:hypothetical protein
MSLKLPLKKGEAGPQGREGITEAMFHAIDINSNNIITREEWSAWLESSAEELKLDRTAIFFFLTGLLSLSMTLTCGPDGRKGIPPDTAPSPEPNPPATLTGGWESTSRPSTS